MHHHDFFNDKSDVYRAARPVYPEELLNAVAELTPGRAAVWDCATGNGQAAIGLARHFSVVHATDVSASQLAHAIPHERVTYTVQEAENPTFPDACHQGVGAAQAGQNRGHAAPPSRRNPPLKAPAFPLARALSQAPQAITQLRRR